MKFFHISDIHFGVENYGKVDAKTGIHTRLLDFAHNFNLVVDAAINEKIDFLVFSGDAYKTAHPTPTQQKLFAQCMLRLQAARIPVAIIVGNHDHPLSFGKAHALDVFSYLPVDGFYVFSKPALMVVDTKSGPVQIVGVPWPTRNTLVTQQAHRFKDNAQIAQYISEKVGDIIQLLAQDADPKIPTILAGHLTVSNGIFSGSEKCAVYGTDPIFLPSQLAIAPFDYVALGHLHRHQNLNAGANTPVVYAGSIERVDFGERKEPKGFCRVCIVADERGVRSTTYEFVELPTRPMIQIEVVLTGDRGQTEQVLEAVRNHEIKDAIVKIIYHLPDAGKDKVDVVSVLQACESAMYVVGVFPVHKPVTRERRAALKIDMDLTTLLTRYFQSKDGLADRRARLIEKTFGLLHEREVAEQQKDS